MQILNNPWISDFWYGFIVLIGLVISIVYYVNHNKKGFRYSLILLVVLCLFSFGMHAAQKPTFENPIEISGLGLDNNNFENTPDYLGKALSRLIDFVRRKFLYY